MARYIQTKKNPPGAQTGRVTVSVYLSAATDTNKRFLDDERIYSSWRISQ